MPAANRTAKPHPEDAAPRTKKPAKPKKAPPVCTRGVKHKPIPWGSDPRYARCAHCGVSMVQSDIGAYDGYYAYGSVTA